MILGETIAVIREWAVTKSEIAKIYFLDNRADTHQPLPDGSVIDLAVELHNVNPTEAQLVLSERRTAWIPELQAVLPCHVDLHWYHPTRPELVGAYADRFYPIYTARPPLSRAQQDTGGSTMTQGWITAVAAVIIMLATVANVVVVRRQLDVMQAGLDATRSSLDQTQRAIATANRQADAAASANQLAQEAVARSRRPWVGVTSTSLGQLLAGKPLDMALEAKNSGQSPAINAVLALRTTIVPAGQVPESPERPCSDCGRYFLLPGGTVQLPVHIDGADMTAALVRQVNNGTAVLWSVGWIDYSDDLGNSHTTQICFRFVPKPSPTLTACSTGNDAN
jgi:hypothetical protein